MTFAAALARARERNFRAHEDGAEHWLDLEDPVERVAALAHRITFETPDGAMSMATSPSGQVRLGDTWAALSDERRQLERRRAAVLLDFAESGKELRSRPEDNVQ